LGVVRFRPFSGYTGVRKPPHRTWAEYKQDKAEREPDEELTVPERARRMAALAGYQQQDRTSLPPKPAPAFKMAEVGDRAARDAILRIIQRYPLPEKRERAEKLLARLDAG
jgi:hypothetical protein